MKRHRNHVLEDLSLTALKQLLPPIWVVHSFHTDYGIDVQVEIFENNGNSTGLRIYGQLKATDKSEAEDVLALDREHFDYWAAHTDPVILFRFFAGSGVIKWCWMHDLEWRMRPSANSLEVSSHLRPWRDAESVSEIIRFAQLRAEALHQKLTAPISISVTSARGGFEESLRLAEGLAERLPARIFEVFGESSSPCHFEVILDDKGLCVGHLGLPGYVITIEDKSLIGDIADMTLLLTFVIAARYDRTLVLRGLANKVVESMWSVADDPVFPLAIEGLMGALGIDNAVTQILEHAPSLEDAVLWISLMTAGTRASLRYGETESWLRQLKIWADTPPHPAMAATAAYNYANHLANAGTAQWDEAAKYYLLAGERDSAYRDRDYFWSELGAAQFEAGEYDTAIAAYQESLKISPSAATGWRLGDAMFHNGNYEAAHTAILEAVRSEEGLEMYPLLVMELCGELISRWHIAQQTIAPVDEETYEQFVALKPAESECDLIAALQPFMDACAVDPLLAFNAGHFANVSKQPQVATYRFLTCALRQRNDAMAWALAFATALQAQLGELSALIAESGYFHTGEDFVVALTKVFSFSAEAPDSSDANFKQQLIDLIRSTKRKESLSFVLRVFEENTAS